MRKSKDITKYNADWQIVRSSIKGSKFSLEEKLSKVKRYFDNNRSEDRWERCVNWCEGLIMGYKAAKNVDGVIIFDLELISCLGRITSPL